MSKKLISHWLPKWVILATKGRECSKCSLKFSKSDIIAVGIRQNGSSVALYVEHECRDCKYRAMTILGKQKEDTLEKMCYALLEGIKQQKVTEKSAELRKKKEGKMTDREVKRMINFIKTTKTHEDLLREMGLSPPEVELNDQD